MNIKRLTGGRRVSDNKISDRVYDKYFIVCVTDYATYDESLIKESDLKTIGHGLYTWAGLKGYINKIIKGTGLSTEFKIDKSSYTYSCYFVDANGKHKAYIGFGILETPDADLLNTLQNMNVPSISDSRKVKDSRGMDDFDYLIDAYGFVVPLGMKVSGKEFADRIKRVYSLENERNAYFYELAKDLAWVEHNTRGFDWSF